MTQQGLLYYFPSKDELLHAALDIRDQRDVVPRLTPWQGLEFLDGIVERICRWRQEPEMVGMFTLLLVENLGDHAPPPRTISLASDDVHSRSSQHAGRDQGNRPGGSRVRPDGPNATVEAIRPGLGPGHQGKQATGRT